MAEQGDREQYLKQTVIRLILQRPKAHGYGLIHITFLSVQRGQGYAEAVPPIGSNSCTFHLPALTRRYTGELPVHQFAPTGQRRRRLIDR